MKLLVCLGNPGDKYINTKHNVGFMFADFLSNKLGLTFKKEANFFGQVAKGDNFLILKPETYMNLSGDSVSRVMRYYKISPTDVVIIQDELDLPFGTYKLQFNRGSAGHKGVEDIFDKSGLKEFYRVRIGIGKSEEFETTDWVLSKFTKEEINDLTKLFSEIESRLEFTLSDN